MGQVNIVLWSQVFLALGLLRESSHAFIFYLVIENSIFLSSQDIQIAGGNINGSVHIGGQCIMHSEFEVVYILWSLYPLLAIRLRQILTQFV